VKLLIEIINRRSFGKKYLLLFSLLIGVFAYGEEVPVVDVKLIDVESTKDGALIKKWELQGESGVKINEIYVQRLPDTIATGDSWSGKIQRNGAFTKSDGSKIPNYEVSSPKNEPPSSAHMGNNGQAIDVSKLVFVVISESSSGTCFLLKDSTNNYIYSNTHVFSGSTNSIIKNAEFKIIPIPEFIEVAHDYDLMRFKATGSDGLHIGELPKIDDEVETYGNSQGVGVITKNSGKVLGVGDSSIEVSCEIVSGNSGGPIIDKHGNVIGIASFSIKRDEDQWNEATRYEKVRRFGIRIDQPIKWESVKYSDFKKDTVLLDAVSDSLDTIISCVQSIDRNKMMITFSLPKTLPSPLRAQTKLDNIVRYHNKDYCNDYTKKTAKEMIYYMYTQIKEASEAAVDDNRPQLNSEWAKKTFDDIKARKDRISVLMVKQRDAVNKSF